MEQDLKENLKQKKTWLRGLYMLLFAIFYSVAEIVILVVVVFQFLLALFTARTNARLVLFGKSLSTYVYQVMLYLTFNSEDKPFPFGEWPAADTPQLTRGDDT